MVGRAPANSGDPRTGEISSVGVDVINMLGNTSAFGITPQHGARWVLAEEPTSRLLPPNRVASLAR